MTKAKRKSWTPPVPTHCDCCGEVIVTHFIDGRTQYGPWAIMCDTCHDSLGVGLGIGLGQLYRREDDGVFYKEQ